MNRASEGPKPASDERLWTDVEHRRYFVIPDNVSMPAGELEIRAANGQRQRVNEATAAPYEVTREQGIEWAKDALRSVMGQLIEGIGKTLGGPAADTTAQDHDNGGTAASGSSPPNSPTPGLDLLADLTARSRDQLAGDYSAMGRALREHFGELGKAARAAVSGDPERMAAAQARMAEWTETLAAHGIRVPTGSDAGAAADPEPQAATAAAETASAPAEPSTADDTSNAAPGPPGLAERLRAMAETLRRRADALAAERAAAGRRSSVAPSTDDTPGSD